MIDEVAAALTEPNVLLEDFVAAAAWERWEARGRLERFWDWLFWTEAPPRPVQRSLRIRLPEQGWRSVCRDD